MDGQIEVLTAFFTHEGGGGYVCAGRSVVDVGLFLTMHLSLSLSLSLSLMELEKMSL